MTRVTLPSGPNTSGKAEWSQVYNNDLALKEVIEGGLDNENLSGTAGITRANLASESKPFTWYAPKVIATEESRTNAAFGTLPTADEITGVVLPTNGLIFIGYRAQMKQSGAESFARVAVFLGSNQLQVVSNAANQYVAQETSSPTGTTFVPVYTTEAGLRVSLINWEAGAIPTTGAVLGFSGGEGTGGGLTVVEANAGTYAISVRYKAASGTVTAKNRKLWVGVLGY